MTKIKNSKNYSQQNLDQPNISCTVISMYPSSSCVMSILQYVGWSPGSKRPRYKVLPPRLERCQQASKHNTSPQAEKNVDLRTTTVTMPTVLLSACTLVSMGLPYVLVDMIASHTRMLGYFSCIFSHVCQNTASACMHVHQIKFCHSHFFVVHVTKFQRWQIFVA